MSSALPSATASAAVGAAADHPPVFKVVGILLAVGSGLLIGTSFPIKKYGLIRAQKKSGNVVGQGHAYLKDWCWWLGMTLMIVGEILNFGAYAFAEALLVTPLGALSVVVSAILSSIFLKEKLTFFGWIGCSQCIVGSIIIALNAPSQPSVTEIRPFQKLFVSPGFLTWAGILIVAALVGIFYLMPRYGDKTMLVPIGICSVIGGLSVSCTQALGATILTSIRGQNQVTYWFFWFLFVFVIFTLLTEINYLNKALALYNSSMVTPTYYVTFSAFTIISSFILYRGISASTIQLLTMVLGFFTICSGITILQMSKVNPEDLVTLDRKSTVLLAAQLPTEEAAQLDEKGQEFVGPEEVGIGLGAAGFGSVMRHRDRRMSTSAGLSSARRPSMLVTALPSPSHAPTLSPLSFMANRTRAGSTADPFAAFTISRTSPDKEMEGPRQTSYDPPSRMGGGSGTSTPGSLRMGGGGQHLSPVEATRLAAAIEEGHEGRPRQSSLRFGGEDAAMERRRALQREEGAGGSPVSKKRAPITLGPKAGGFSGMMLFKGSKPTEEPLDLEELPKADEKPSSRVSSVLLSTENEKADRKDADGEDEGKEK